ncbi:GNAT family N-acetyltransferase [Lutimaribacter marinistellae]|uniref:GNAT family N-acetyltransferase n=1 Tax=Lutimaribacter marinistellae TaxID=1820329 RepID=A0ABV7TI99_9RHOB
MIRRGEPRDLHALAEILHACVHDGASVGFILPFATEQAEAWWRGVMPTLEDGQRELFVAEVEGVVRGTVQLSAAAMPNQPHRADVMKLLVHPQARRQGLGRALMEALEERAKALGRRLLVLDTRSSDPSRLLYLGLGYVVAGEIPGYCRNPFAEVYEPTTYMYKVLE